MGFQTPVTFASLAACLADESCAWQLHVGDDLLELQLPKGVAVVPKYDLLIHFILIGCKEHAFPLAGPQRALRCRREASSEQRAAAEFETGFDEPALAAMLASAWLEARKHEHNWLQKLAKGNGKTQMDATAVVRAFFEFLESRGLPLTLLGDLSRRRLVVLLGWFCLVSRLEEIEQTRKPVKRHKDSNHKELTDVLAQAKKMQLDAPPEDVFPSDS